MANTKKVTVTFTVDPSNYSTYNGKTLPRTALGAIDAILMCLEHTRNNPDYPDEPIYFECEGTCREAICIPEGIEFTGTNTRRSKAFK